ncbi:MAG: hypothetical protein IJ428_03585 [Clostridia bacterium]|nr:hypothetical protein [Clostridia bacterium]
MKNTDDKRPRGAEPVKNIEVSESHIKPRAILAGIFLLIGIAAIGWCVMALLETDPGWQTVEVSLSEPSSADEFTLNYLFGSSGRNATSENKALTALYTGACIKAYKLFDAERMHGGVNNVYYINSHVNEEIEVDPILYEAFEKIEAYGSRYLYLAPIYDEYDAAFFGIEMPESVGDMDPYVDSEFSAELKALAEYANAPEHVSLRLLGDNKVMLYVSDAYLEFAGEYGVESYIDFYRMRNAFIIDYFAGQLIENGFTHATLTSYDGYTRNLDKTGSEYAFNIFDRVGNDIYIAAELNYTSPSSMVTMRNFPLSERDSYRYFISADRTITPYIDHADGLYRNAASSMVAYSSELGCADILLRSMPVYISNEVDTDAVEALANDGIEFIWCEDAVIYHTDEAARFGYVYSDNEVTYGTQRTGE